ncbi:protein kinase domain-containing protein [Roseimaritima ulvae]|uniref:Serine/threonine-protein kinase PknB n=1 Tax=Roseimaritima ulvae TaxID=980254 RepID=A0A5B9QVL4_9BACT|nr:protein kinase [Roseimaritima ulvae]QEG43084.1 Serine/threonine-protein kinase PknB [Roseimaritima ulvae]
MTSCDDLALDALLDADEASIHSGENLADVAQHVESCSRCQSRLSQRAADDQQWDQLQQWLSPDELDSEIDTDSLGVPTCWQRPTAWTESMAKALLSQPLHPEMLGRIGRYDVERLIGSGGMGVVFKAHDTELHRPVAIKLLAPYLAESGAARKRFAREARAAAAVVDEHVVAIHNVESDVDPEQAPFLVMKYIAGGSLQQRLDREGSLELCEILRIGTHTAKGLAAAHAQGLIHRDVKPSNILLDEGVERALLTDFGLARTEDDACLTRSGFHPGTPHYMSPEQVRGEPIDARSDLFGLGCVLYALCSGHPPFRAETSYAVLRRITDDRPRPLRETNANIPEWLDRIVMKLLSKSPNDRFASAAQVAEVLEGCLAHTQHPTTTPLPDPVAALLPQRSHRPPWIKVAMAAAFAFAMLFAGVLLVLETNKGTIRIETNSDSDIPIVIRQGDKTVEHLTVTQQGTAIRLKAGTYIIEVEGDDTQLMIKGGQVTLTRQGTWLAIITETKTTGTPPSNVPLTTAANPLLGTWRVMSFVDDGTKVAPHENSTVTFDGWRVTWTNEPDDVSRSMYRLLPHNTLQLVAENATSTADVVHHYRYTMTGPDSVRLEAIATPANPHVNGSIELERLRDATELSAYVSRSVTVNTSDRYGVSEEEVIHTHVMLIRSGKLLASVQRPADGELMPADTAKAIPWLQANLTVKPTTENQIEIGIHGHHSSKQQREQIVDSVVTAYKQTLAAAKTDAAQKVIQRLVSARAELQGQRLAAQAAVDQLRKTSDVDSPKLQHAIAQLDRLTQVITKLDAELLQYAVPANPPAIDALPGPAVIPAMQRIDQATASKVPTKWDVESNHNILWRAPLGSVAMRAPLVHGDHVYVGTNNDHGYLPRYPSSVDLGVLLCFRKSDGKFMWQHSNEKLPSGRAHDWPLQGITSRPCVEGDRLWYITNRAEIVCLDTSGFRDGKNDGPVQDETNTDENEADVVWRLDMMRELGVRPHNVSTCTIAVWKDRIFAVTGNGVGPSHVPPIADAPSFIAVDKSTGKLLWQDHSPGQNVLHGQWGSPLVADLAGRTQVIFPGGDGWLYSFDPQGTSDGKAKLIWKFDCNPKDSVWKAGGAATRNNLLHAPTVHDGLLYIAMGQDPEHGSGPGRVWCIDPSGSGDVSPEIVFNRRDPKTPIPHRRIQACVAAGGDYTSPNPNSKAVWQFQQTDVNGNGEFELEERMGRSLSTIEIRGDLLFVSDIDGILHCLDRRTGKQHWGFDTLANTYTTPLIVGDFVYLGNEDGDVCVFRCSADPDVAMPGGEPLARNYCDQSINASVVSDGTTLYFATKNELFAVGTKIAE